jgi:protein-disulfide isomerase-like protein with CxxC motif
VSQSSFAITYDYLCPFARNASEAVVDALEAGADWAVAFRPFSLQQNHKGDEELPVWDHALDADMGSGVRALLWSIAVRDEFPNSFLAFHTALFAARHEDALDIGDEEVLRDVANAVGLDDTDIAGIVATGMPQKRLKDEHSSLVEDFEVFGVPTFIVGGEAVFVRIMDRHNVADVTRVIDMLEWTNLNEFKRTRIPK